MVKKLLAPLLLVGLLGVARAQTPPSKVYGLDISPVAQPQCSPLHLCLRTQGGVLQQSYDSGAWATIGGSGLPPFAGANRVLVTDATNTVAVWTVGLTNVGLSGTYNLQGNPRLTGSMRVSAGVDLFTLAGGRLGLDDGSFGGDTVVLDNNLGAGGTIIDGTGGGGVQIAPSGLPVIIGGAYNFDPAAGFLPSSPVPLGTAGFPWGDSSMRDLTVRNLYSQIQVNAANLGSRGGTLQMQGGGSGGLYTTVTASVGTWAQSLPAKDGTFAMLSDVAGVYLPLAAGSGQPLSDDLYMGAHELKNTLKVNASAGASLSLVTDAISIVLNQSAGHILFGGATRYDFDHLILLTSSDGLTTNGPISNTAHDTGGRTFTLSGDSQLSRIIFGAGSAAAVSGADTATIAYNESTHLLRVSNNTGAYDTIATLTATQTLTGKTIAGGSNTISGISSAMMTSIGTGAGSCTYCSVTFDAAGRETAYSSGTAPVTSVATGNGLSGGPITTTGTVDLRLNASGGLLKTLGAGSNELGIDVTFSPTWTGTHIFSTKTVTVSGIGGALALTPTATTGAPTRDFTDTGAAHTALTALQEFTPHLVDLSATLQFNSGALPLERAMLVKGPTVGFTGASTCGGALYATGGSNGCATFAIDKAPVVGTSATINNDWTIWTQAGITRHEDAIAATITAVLSLGTNVAATTGAQKWSGALELQANGFDSTASSSKYVVHAINVRPIQTAGSPTSELLFTTSSNTATRSEYLKFAPAVAGGGNTVIQNAQTSGGIRVLSNAGSAEVCLNEATCGAELGYVGSSFYIRFTSLGGDMVGNFAMDNNLLLSGSLRLHKTSVGDANVTVNTTSTGDNWVAFTTTLTAGRTATLPDPATAGAVNLSRIVFISDVENTGATHNITIVAAAGTIVGTSVINTNGGSAYCISDGVSVWICK